MKTKKFLPLLVTLLALMGCSSNSSSISSRSDFTYDPATSMPKDNPVDNITFPNSETIKAAFDALGTGLVTEDKILELIEVLDQNDLYPTKVDTEDITFNGRRDSTNQSIKTIRSESLTRDNDKKTVSGTSKYVIETLKVGETETIKKTVNGTYNLTHDYTTESYLSKYVYDDETYNKEETAHLTETSYSNMLNLARGKDFIKDFHQARKAVRDPNSVFNTENEKITLVSEDNIHTIAYSVNGTIKNIKCTLDMVAIVDDGVLKETLSSYKEIDMTTIEGEVLLLNQKKRTITI